MCYHADIPHPTLGSVSSCLFGPVDPSFRALSGRLKFTVRRHKLNTDFLSWQAETNTLVMVNHQFFLDQFSWQNTKDFLASCEVSSSSLLLAKARIRP
jgi:hypothetical protein